ncbi:MAG: hypothetical protein M3X11_08360, partial [Acidobacteriota bacterium]|nr:hypothetical protein [Acidobacteriota bacterium]
MTRGIYQIGWPVWANDFEAVLEFGHFKVPLRWRPHLLRAGIFSKGAMDGWTEQPPALPLEYLTFDHSIRIEAIEGAKYQIFADVNVIRQGTFGDPPQLELPLAAFKDGV